MFESMLLYMYTMMVYRYSIGLGTPCFSYQSTQRCSKFNYREARCLGDSWKNKAKNTSIVVRVLHSIIRSSSSMSITHQRVCLRVLPTYPMTFLLYPSVVFYFGIFFFARSRTRRILYIFSIHIFQRKYVSSWNFPRYFPSMKYYLYL